jgi:hypothetical protein
MLTAIATRAFCSPNTPAPRRLPKQVTDFVARTPTRPCLSINAQQRTATVSGVNGGVGLDIKHWKIGMWLSTDRPR